MDSIHLGPAPRLAEQDRDYAEPPNTRRSALSVNTSVRSEVVAFFEDNYLAPRMVTTGWTGDVFSCQPGSTSAAYADATIQTVNYFRAMAGLPGNVGHDPAMDAMCQRMALMIVANNAISYTPPPSWACYTADGAQAAGKSLMASGLSGPRAVALFMNLPASSDPELGFRRWIMYPPQVTMGTGSVGTNFTGNNTSTVLWVLGPFGSRPAEPGFVAWPPEGFVPFAVVYPRWSFSMPGANFAGTTISMKKDGEAMAPIAAAALQFGYGDNTVTWTPPGIVASAGMPDTTYTVTLSNVVVNSVSQTFEYEVTIIDPAMVPVVPQVDGLRIY